MACVEKQVLRRPAYGADYKTVSMLWQCYRGRPKKLSNEWIKHIAQQYATQKDNQMSNH